MFGFKRRLIIALAFILSLALLVPACAAPAEEEGLQPVIIKISADVPPAPHPKGRPSI